MKIALALIVKGTDKEAKLLDRCLENVSPFVDGIFITSTYRKGEKPNENVEKIAKLYNANLSTFEWVNDFAKARNFNFGQVTKDYDYILWCDADDVFRGLEKLRPTLEENKMVDVFAFWYLYDFDEYKNPTVVHKKSQLVKNDGCVHWEGSLHEDFVSDRELSTKFIEGIERLHLTTQERFEVAKERNVEVATHHTEEKPNDPRSWWNLANSYFGNGEYTKSKDCFVKFLKMTESEDEKYLARLRLGAINSKLGEINAVEDFQIAIGMKPEIPDAYLQLGQYYSDINSLDKAEKYLLLGLKIKPQYHGIIVYNPRDYDYNPMMLLSQIYFKKNRPDLAIKMLKGCLQIIPESEYLKGLIKEMEKEEKRVEGVVKHSIALEKIKDKEKLRKALDKIPKDLQSHPRINQIRNENFIKTETSGKDIAYFCGYTEHVWNPELFKTKGFGGSEEAVVNLSKQWVKNGYNVTVYNNCGTEEMTVDGVTYKPFWTFNSRDKWDYLIVWRHPRMLDYGINATNVYVDMHDVIPKGEFTPTRLAKITKIFFKTNFHKGLFSNIPDDKCVVIPNGMDFELFNQDVKKDRYLLVNTSSPDRSMDVMPKLFKMVKEQVPGVRMKWAYGWDIFDQAYGDNAKMMDWRKKLQADIDEAGIESLGKIPQSECAKLYLEGNILAYPSEFAEIDCISVKKAQACGCIPVTTDFGAFDESVQYGVKIHSDKTNETWSRDYQFSFGLEDEEKQKEWVDAVVKILKEPIKERKEMLDWSKKFAWDLIANKWLCQ